MELEKVELKKKTIRKNKSRIAGNEVISEYYKDFGIEQDSDTLTNRSLWVSQCYKFWDIDNYKVQRVRDVKRITLCKDKFCLNCQNNLALKREVKYKDILDLLRQHYDIYHCVFTVPNCSAQELVSTIDRMYKKFPYLIQYLQGKRKCNNVDFLDFGFRGAVRGFEVTTKRIIDGYEFHPHFHCLFVLRKGLDNKKKHTNDFSFSNGKKTRDFSDSEILFQKAWRLLYEGERLTYDSLKSLKEGYSVTMEDSKGKYHQVFKYALKGVFKKGAPLFSYEEFKDLYKALYRRKMIQGYGILNAFKFEEDISDAEIDTAYLEIVNMLKSVELPQAEILTLESVLKDLEDNRVVKYISRNAVRRELKGNGND